MVVVGRFNECVMVGRQFESVKSGRDGCPRLPPLPLTGPSLGMRRDKPLCECASRHPPDLYRTWLLPRNHPHMYRFQMFCVWQRFVIRIQWWVCEENSGNFHLHLLLFSQAQVILFHYPARALRAGLKGLRAESAMAFTGRRNSHSGRGKDFLSRQPNFSTETAVTWQRKVQKSFPRWEINRHAKG